MTSYEAQNLNRFGAAHVELVGTPPGVVRRGGRIRLDPVQRLVRLNGPDATRPDETAATNDSNLQRGIRARVDATAAATPAKPLARQEQASLPLRADCSGPERRYSRAGLGQRPEDQPVWGLPNRLSTRLSVSA
jgi:hypothetical protein